MDDELKGKFDKVFDAGELRRLPGELESRIQADPEAAAYYRKLSAIETTVSAGEEIHIPAGFAAGVLFRLPGTVKRTIKILRWQDLFLPAYFVALLVVIILFRDQFGITALLDTVGNQLAASGEAGVEITFMVVSSAGILMATWIIIESFFGIGSRSRQR